VPFAVFSTAGTEDFNYMEMQLLDRKLTSAHFLAVFQGGHTLPPDDVAFDALEWMEIQAMQSGRRGRDDALVKRIVEKRRTDREYLTLLEQYRLQGALISGSLLRDGQVAEQQDHP
jgi:hypothetical protein